jgi:hypothetical protein
MGAALCNIPDQFCMFFSVSLLKIIPPLFDTNATIAEKDTRAHLWKLLCHLANKRTGAIVTTPKFDQDMLAVSKRTKVPFLDLIPK